MIGPLPPCLASSVHVSPMGLVPKSQPNKWRVIVDLSSPQGKSVNDGIAPDRCSLHHALVDNAIEVIMGLGRSTLLVKLDLSSAYCIVPVHPDDQPLLGVAWQSCTYVDRSLPFGLRSAPKIFNAVADFLAWILHCNGVTFVLHYLDDFLTFSPPGSELASTMRSQVKPIFSRVGVPIAHEKTVGPSTTLTFLGIEIDTDLLQLRLPREKVDKLKTYWLSGSNAGVVLRENCNPFWAIYLTQPPSSDRVAFFYTICLQPCPACHTPAI